MTICILLVLIMGVALAFNMEGLEGKMFAVILSAILLASVVLTATFSEEKGKATALRATGWTEYTKTELYEMSDKQKDLAVKTYDWDKVRFWKIEENK